MKITVLSNLWFFYYYLVITNKLFLAKNSLSKVPKLITIFLWFSVPCIILYTFTKITISYDLRFTNGKMARCVLYTYSLCRRENHIVFSLLHGSRAYLLFSSISGVVLTSGKYEDDFFGEKMLIKFQTSQVNYIFAERKKCARLWVSARGGGGGGATTHN